MRDGLCVWQLLRRVLYQHHNETDDAQAEVAALFETTLPRRVGGGL